jgi:hypothetical protein
MSGYYIYISENSTKNKANIYDKVKLEARVSKSNADDVE